MAFRVKLRRKSPHRFAVGDDVQGAGRPSLLGRVVYVSPPTWFTDTVSYAVLWFTTTSNGLEVVKERDIVPFRPVPGGRKLLGA